MAVAGLYALWGALLGGSGAAFFLRADGTAFAPLRVLLAWSVLALVEARVFRIPWWGHVAGASVAGLCWIPLLRHIDPARVVPIAIAAHAVSRAAAIGLVWVSRPAREGMALARRLDSFSAGIAVSCGAAAALLCGIRPAVLIVMFSILILRGTRHWFYQKIGGVNTVALSLTQHATELSTLLIAVFVR